MGARLSTIENYIGKKYGKLTVVADLGCISTGKRRVVTAICECGVIKDYMMSHLKKGDTKSCGCILKEIRYGAEFINVEIVTEDSRFCVACKNFKPKNNFHKAGKKEIQSKCKECMAAYKKERYWSDHESQLEKHKNSRTKPENLLQRKGYYEKNKDEYKERYLKYIADEEKRERIRKRAKVYNKVAYEKISKRASAYSKRPEVKARKMANHKKRKKEDAGYMMKLRLRNRFRSVLRALGGAKYKKTSCINLLGCDMEFFKKYIEDKFKDGMCWERMSEIHIDHIKPCAKFDLTKLEEQQKCFHYSNLQPLWSVDNLRKNAFYED